MLAVLSACHGAQTDRQSVLSIKAHLSSLFAHLTAYLRALGTRWKMTCVCVCTGAIVSVSLASDCVMAFRRNGDQRELLLPRRSLLVISGEARCVLKIDTQTHISARHKNSVCVCVCMCVCMCVCVCVRAHRYAWEHQIPNRKYDDLGVPPTTDNNPLTPIMASLTASATSQDHMSPPGPSPPIPNAYITRANRISLTLRQVCCTFPVQVTYRGICFAGMHPGLCA